MEYSEADPRRGKGGSTVVVIMWTVDEAGKAAAIIAVVQWLGTYMHTLSFMHTHALTGMMIRLA